MSDDAELHRLMRQLAALNEIDYIIETGTYNGLGSTTAISECFSGSQRLKKLYTIEVDYVNYTTAKRNLKNYPFVECVYGSSVNLRDAINFVENDTAIKNHLLYDNIFIDNIEDPVSFYINELKGKLIDKNAGFLQKIFRPSRKPDLLNTLINKLLPGTLFIVLDSAGGVGHLEFQIVQKNLSEADYYILLDDIHHLKHFRDFETIRTNKEFKLLGFSEENGWALAKHSFLPE